MEPHDHERREAGERPEPAGDPAGEPGDPGQIRDALPEDLDITGYVGPYQFPDNKRRRIPGVLYLLVAGACIAGWAVAGDDAVLVNDGFLWVGVALALFGLYSIAAGQPTAVDERQALTAATRAVGFPVGHASAQLAWRGLRSRPTWRILVYSADEPPTQRGLVLVDAVDAEVVAHFTEANPEEWAPDPSAPERP